MKATISILGLYNFDNTLFDNMVLPSGIDRDTVINNMLLELAELEVIYSNFDVLKMSIGMWSKKELPVWEKLYATTQFEYDPISNYDRTEEWTEKETRDLKNSNNQTRDLKNSNNQTRDLQNSNNQTHDISVSKNASGNDINTGADITTESVTGFNSEIESLKNKNKIEHGLQTTHTNSESGTDKGSVNGSGTDTGTINDSGTDTGTINNSGTDTGTIDNIRKGRAYGNIGVTTTQQMIEQERETVKFNITDYIIESFKNRFCILIY